MKRDAEVWLGADIPTLIERYTTFILRELGYNDFEIAAWWMDKNWPNV